MPTIIRMVNHTRLDCLIGSAAGMRWGTAQAMHHARHRSAFGEAAGRAAGDAERAGRPGDRVRGRHRHRHADRARLRRGRRPRFRRFATAVSKYWVCKRAPPHAVEALECLGRQRLRGGVGHAAAAPRLAAQLDLGGLGQRGRARRAARDGQGARGAAGVPGRGRAGGGRQRPPGRPRGRGSSSAWRACGEPRTRSSPPGAWSRTWAWRCRARCSCATRPRRWRTRSAPSRLAREGGHAWARCPPGSTPRRSSDRALAAD